jgi:hypothetical protein
MRSEDSCGAGSGLQHAPGGLATCRGDVAIVGVVQRQRHVLDDAYGLLDQQVYCSAVHSGLLRPCGAVAASWGITPGVT